MSRQLEHIVEVRQAKREAAIVKVVEYGLEGSIARAGAALIGISVSFREEDCLMVVKAELAGRRQVAFVGAADFGSVLIKAQSLAMRDKLVWKEDKYAG